jgi:phage-related protein
VSWKIECYIESKGNNPVEKFIEPNGVIVLLHGFTKRSQKTPRREMELALKRMEEI